MAKENNIGKSMMLVKGYWQKGDTFKMLPVTKDCPYLEVIYDPSTTLLALVSQFNKDNYQMVTKLDVDGNPIRVKKPGPNGEPFQQERRRITVKQEYYITEKAEQEAFIEMFAINADTFDYKKIVRDLEEEKNAIVTQPEAKGVVDQHGMAITKK